MFSIQLQLAESHFVRDPQQTTLGRRIVSEAVPLLEQLGFDRFTFGKLALRIGSTEASVYRYFENKHRLFAYLFAAYWGLLLARIRMHTHNVQDARARLRRIAAVLAGAVGLPLTAGLFDEVAMRRVVVQESGVGPVSRLALPVEGRAFASYEALCSGIAAEILQFSPSFRYPVALASTVVDASHRQSFMALINPDLTEIATDSGAEDLADYLDLLMLAPIEA